MNRAWLGVVVPGLLISVAGCPDVKVDPGEGVDDMTPAGPIVEFNPSAKIIPFPNNLLLDPMTGKVTLPMQCGEGPATTATREGVLNKLDGFGLFKTAMSVTFTKPVDAASLAGKVLLYKRATGTAAVDPTSATAIPVVTLPGMSTRFSADCSTSSMVDSLTIVPMVPLEQKSSYVVALTTGIKTADGEDYGPAYVWALVRQEENPVELDANGNVVSDRTPLDPNDPIDLATLQGVDLLWKAHALAMQFLRGTGKTTEDIVLAWEFKTQTVTDQFDATVTGSPAAEAATTPALAGVARVNAGADGETFLRGALPANSCQADGGPLPCQAVAEIVAGGLLAKQFQVATPNPLAGGATIPGPWGDPVKPAVVTGTAPVIAFAGVTTAACATTTGCPTVVFQHGLGRSKNDMFAIVSQLAGAGFNVVAIDAVAHGSRAIQNTDAAALGCGGTPAIGTAPQCFAPFLSTNLGGTRDNIRQSIVDHHALIAAIKACGSANCGLLKVDPASIVYAGQSLGGIMGGVTAASHPDIKASVLNVGGVGWVDVLENTETLAIRCPLVNGLIDAGILMGDKWSPATPTVGLCLTDAWKTQPGYRSFSAIARWILDAGDPANFTTKLAPRRFLIQEVVGDAVVPNVATRTGAALVGLTAAAADCGTSPPGPASAAITTNPMTTKYVQYANLTAAQCAPAGNTFGHGSLLSPAAATPAGSLALARMQTDAITFLSFNR